MSFKSDVTGKQGDFQTITNEQFYRSNENGSTDVIAFSYDTTGQITSMKVHNCYRGTGYGPHTLSYLLSQRARAPNDGNLRLIIISASGFDRQSLINVYQNTAASWTLQVHTDGNVGIAYGMKATAALLYSLSLSNARCGGITREKRIELIALHLTNLLKLTKDYPDWFNAIREQSKNPNPEDHLGTTAMRCVMSAAKIPGWTPLSDAEFIERLFRVMQRNRKHSNKANFKFSDDLGGIMAFLIMRYFGSGTMNLGESVQKVVTNLLSCVKKHLDVDSRPATPAASDDEFFDWLFGQANVTAWTSLKAMRMRADKVENIAFIKAIIECCLNSHCCGTEELLPYADAIYETYVQPGKPGEVIGDKTLVVTNKVTFPDGSFFAPRLDLPDGCSSDGCVMKRRYDLPTHYIVTGGGTTDFTSVRFPVPSVGSSMTYHVRASGLPSSTGDHGARFLARLVGPNDVGKMAWKHDVSGGGFTVSNQSGGGCGDGKSNPITDKSLKAPVPLAKGDNGSLVHVTITCESTQKFVVTFKCDGWSYPIELIYNYYTNNIPGSKSSPCWNVKWNTSSGYSRASYTINRSKLTHLAFFFKGLTEITIDEQTIQILKPTPINKVQAATSAPVAAEAVSSVSVSTTPVGDLSLGDIIKNGLQDGLKK